MVSFSRIANPDNKCKVGFKMGKFFAEGEGYKQQLKEIIMNCPEFDILMLQSTSIIEFNNKYEIIKPNIKP